ncbi:hypothetical protein GGP41_005120 [Bipolaris sorokiniana]|uniref:Uncharacterized protein n=1 Tax=Cochliobolus sativus TaxID=45130 RepID=A0A8H6DVR2_COCSA|nr:hypothetical protein GGP41_005120 [Bipolaris sorokiniana]
MRNRTGPYGGLLRLEPHMVVRPVRILQAARMVSTLVGQSGREYSLQKVLQRHPKKPELSVCLALYGKTPYAVKPVSESILGHLQKFKAGFKTHPHLRNPIDKIEKRDHSCLRILQNRFARIGRELSSTSVDSEEEDVVRDRENTC